MRHSNLVLIMASALTLVACSRVELPLTGDGEMVLELTATTPELPIASDTKSTLDQGTAFGWETNDQLGFIPSASTTHPESDRQSMFYVQNISEGGKDACFIGNGWGLIRGKRYYSYYPYSDNNSCSSVYVNYTGQVQTANGSSGHLGDYDYLHSWIDMPLNGDVSLSYRRIGCVAKISVTVPQNSRTAKFTKLTLSSSGNIFLASGTYNPSSEYPITGSSNQGETVTFSTADKTNSMSLNLGTGNGITCDDNGQLVLYLMMSPTTWANNSISLILDGISGTGSDSVQLNGTLNPSKDQTAGVCYTYSSILPEPEDITDLSANSTANSYIVTTAGKYRFRADVKGNGVPAGSESSALATPVCAYLVWETVNTTTAPVRNSIVTNIEYKEGFVYFEVPDNGITGNAMIALLNTEAMDSFTANGGKTIWVWHIWRLDQVPADNDYGGGVIFMDRNLGALNNTSGDGRAIGLLYQWGRPVPMLGAADYTTNSVETVARIVNNTDGSGSSVSIPYWTNSGPFSLNDAFGSPLQYFVGTNGNRHWTTDYPLELWKSTKTQYDPCPPGYKVPANFTGFSLVGSLSQYGGNLNCNGGANYWWPIGGLRGLSFTKDLSNTGHDSTYWSCEAGYYSPVSGDVGFGLNFNLNNSSVVTVSQASYIITGNSVRCQKIQ